MPIGVLFWVLMVLWFVFGVVWHRTELAGGNYGFFGGHVLQFALFALIGWKLFGPVLQ